MAFWVNSRNRTRWKLVVLLPQDLGDVPGDGLPFPVRVGAQVDLRDARRHFLQLLDDLGLSQDGDVFGLKVVLQVDPQLIWGRSLTWPLLESTSKSSPRYFCKVLALVGDSTMSNDLGILINYNRFLDLPVMGRNYFGRDKGSLKLTGLSRTNGKKEYLTPRRQDAEDAGLILAEG